PGHGPFRAWRAGWGCSPALSARMAPMRQSLFSRWLYPLARGGRIGSRPRRARRPARLNLETLEARSSPTSMLEHLALLALARERAAAPALLSGPGATNARTLPPSHVDRMAPQAPPAAPARFDPARGLRLGPTTRPAAP